MPEYSITHDHRRILGMFAHPDDEVFCAGGVLAHCTAASAEVLVVSATRGQAGQIRDPRAATRRTLGEVRAQELARACTRLGVGQAYCLDYLDGTLRDVAPDRLAADVATIIQDFAPDAVITFGPDGGYGHPDHVAISAATTRAWAGVANAATQPALYYSHFPRRDLLPFTQLAEWLVAQDRRFQGSEEFAHGLALFAESATMLGFARDNLRVQWFPEGFSIVEQGEVGGSLYLILSGRVEVVQEEGDGTRCVLRRMAAGEFFGELSVAHGRPLGAPEVLLQHGDRAQVVDGDRDVMGVTERPPEREAPLIQALCPRQISLRPGNVAQADQAPRDTGRVAEILVQGQTPLGQRAGLCVIRVIERQRPRAVQHVRSHLRGQRIVQPQHIGEPSPSFAHVAAL